MNESAENSQDREARLDRLIAHCYQAMEAGDGLNQDSIIKANPEFAEELREFFSDVSVMEQWVPGDAAQQPSELLVATTPFDSSLDKDAEPSTRISQYEVIEQIGSRPLGVVLKARHVNLRRIVALKLLRHGEWASPREINRLKIEARTVTNLNHPGIVNVHEFGLHRGRHFVVMDYVDGGSLSQRIAQGPLTPTRSAQLLFQIASAVQAAHEAGVIHRDLATEPLVDNDRLTESEFVHEQRQVIAPNHRRGWTWKVRAWIDGHWTPWSEEKHFDISAGVPIPNGPPGVPNAGTKMP